MNQRPPERHLEAFSLRKSCDVSIGNRGQAQQGDRVGDACVQIFAGYAVQLTEVPDVFARRQSRIEAAMVEKRTHTVTALAEGR